MNITAKELEVYSRYYDTISDIDSTYPENKPSLEWDGPYGKHWVVFNTEEELAEVLAKHQQHMNSWVIKYRVSLIKAKHEARRKHEEFFTLGGQFPQLEQIKNKLAA